MSRARERRNLDLEEETKENEATLSQEDSTDIEGEEASMQRGKTSGVSRKSGGFCPSWTAAPKRLSQWPVRHVFILCSAPLPTTQGQGPALQCAHRAAC